MLVGLQKITPEQEGHICIKLGYIVNIRIILNHRKVYFYHHDSLSLKNVQTCKNGRCCRRGKPNHSRGLNVRARCKTRARGKLRVRIRRRLGCFPLSSNFKQLFQRLQNTKERLQLTLKIVPSNPRDVCLT